MDVFSTYPTVLLNICELHARMAYFRTRCRQSEFAGEFKTLNFSVYPTKNAAETRVFSQIRRKYTMSSVKTYQRTCIDVFSHYISY